MLRLPHTLWPAEMFKTLCTVTADTPQMAKGLQQLRSPRGDRYWNQNYSIVLLFGLTELKAQISWMEDVSWFTLL
jgi:hypothetical protein